MKTTVLRERQNKHKTSSQSNKKPTIQKHNYDYLEKYM
jgi:hypothetical protein